MIQYRTNLEQIPTTHNIMEREQMIQYHNTIPRLRRPTPRLGLSSFTACTSCSCRPLWNRCAKPAFFCLQRPRYSPLCLPTQLYSQIIVRGRDSEPDGKPPPHQPMEGSWKSRNDNCRQRQLSPIDLLAAERHRQFIRSSAVAGDNVPAAR